MSKDIECDHDKSRQRLASAEDVLHHLSLDETPKSESNTAIESQSDSTPSLSKHKGKESNVHFKYASTVYDVRMLSKDISKAKVALEVENLMIVTKLNDVSLYYLTRELVEWLLVNYPNITIYVDSELKDDLKFAAKDLVNDSQCSKSRLRYWTPEFIDNNDVFFDICITLGGDGTVLFVSSLFQRHVPPILSFALGSLGFLTNFKFENFRQVIQKIFNNKIKTNLRMRLECKVIRRGQTEVDPETGKKVCMMEEVSSHHILNEVTIDRGPSPFISMLELYGDDSLMTVAQADGLIVATPTGSTAYSLSAGGSLICPTVNAIAVTPVCPHTLSFRPIILPDTILLKVKVPLRARGTAWAAFDGKDRVELQKGDYITISASPYAFPTVESSVDEFVHSISRTFNWNAREQQKSFTHMLSDKNKEKYVTEKDNEKSSDEEIEERKVGGNLTKLEEGDDKHEKNPSVNFTV